MCTQPNPRVEESEGWVLAMYLSIFVLRIVAIKKYISHDYMLMQRHLSYGGNSHKKLSVHFYQIHGKYAMFNS